MNYGGFWIRFLAYIVDSAIVTIAFIGVLLGLTLMGLELFAPSFIYFLFGVLYFALMQSSTRQATIGKALCGLKVTDAGGERISLPRALAREVAKIISTLTLLIGYVIAAFTTRKQALHDFVASTTVVRAEPGRVVIALAVAVLALASPFIVGILFGAAILTAALGPMAEMMGNEVVVPVKPAPTAQAPKPAAAPVVVAQAPKPAAPQPVVVVPPTAKPVPVAQVTTEPAKPAAAPAKPAAAPAKPAAAIKEPVKPEPAAPVADKPAPPEEPVAAATPPRKAAPIVPPQMVAGPTVPGPKYNDLVTAALYRDAEAVNGLLALGKWADKPDSRGTTPLMIATMQGDAPIAEALLKAGANPNRPGPGGETALSIARERKDAAMVGLLERTGR
jgi:uncharacterized RDD family membrane protein YckC